MTRNIRPLPARSAFFARFARNVGLATALVSSSLIVGAIGYHVFERLPWVDSFLNASMILAGMGPVDHLESTSGKIFATCYALFSGLVFLSTAVLLLTPVARRILHRLHLDIYSDPGA